MGWIGLAQDSCPGSKGGEKVLGQEWLNEVCILQGPFFSA